MSDSDRISQLEKDIREIKNKIKKDKRENPDYKKKKPTEYNKFIKNFCESAKAKEGDEYDHKKTFSKAAAEWGILKKNSDDKKDKNSEEKKDK
jgi:hypothetical protein